MKFALDVVPFGVHSEPAVLVGHAEHAEAAGWDGMFFWDHLSMPPWAASVADPWAVIAAAAARTQRLTLGTAVTPIPRHHPAVLARTVATVDRLSGGRVVLGAGLGVDEESRHYGWPAAARERAEITDESLGVIGPLLAGDTITHQGQHYVLEGAAVAPPPVRKPRVPIWIGASNRRTLARAARWDGWVIGVSDRDGSVAITPEEVADRVSVIRSQRHGDEVFDVAVAGISRDSFDSPAEPVSPSRKRLIAEYEDAGATWWLELAGGGGAPDYVDQTRTLIACGPPGAN